MAWVDQGGALLTFPAGAVSHWSFQTGQVVDPPWLAHIVRLIRLAQAKTLPIYIHGRNSLLFSLAGLLHPELAK
jgi:putative hemolysin